MKLLTALVILLAWSNSFSDIIQKWTDESGQVHYGDTPPLAELVEVCRRHGARLMIDEAHSAFVFGETGKGVAEDQGLDDEIDIHLGTFSKSLGGQGGYIAGSRQLVNYLREYYLEYKVGPSILRIGKATGLSPKKICCLFDCGVARGAYRLAGLPRPGGCV